MGNISATWLVLLLFPTTKRCLLETPSWSSGCKETSFLPGHLQQAASFCPWMCLVFSLGKEQLLHYPCSPGQAHMGAVGLVVAVTLCTAVRAPAVSTVPRTE